MTKGNTDLFPLTPEGPTFYINRTIKGVPYSKLKSRRNLEAPERWSAEVVRQTSDKDSLYEAGKRTGSRIKCRVNRGQEFVIGGYVPGPHGFDSLIIGYYAREVQRERNGRGSDSDPCWAGKSLCFRGEDTG